MAPYNGLMLLTTQPLALRKKREEDERMNQRFKISEKPKDCVIRIDLGRGSALSRLGAELELRRSGSSLGPSQ